jgi:excisionase family DNA binding protein
MWLSVDQVAERLGLHVRTVRGYIRDGRLRAARIGKQYRVESADLDAFTGRSPPARTRVEVSTVVELDRVSATAADRLSTLLLAGAQLPRDTPEPLRLRTVYDDERGRLKVIILGGLAATADVLRTIDQALAGILDDDPGGTQWPTS